MKFAYSDGKATNKGTFSVENFYMGLPHINIGGYVAFNTLFEFEPVDSQFWLTNGKNDLGVTLAFTSNLSLLPMVNNRFEWFDVYALCRLGFTYAYAQNNFPERGFHKYYAIGGGVSIDFYKRFSAYTEVSNTMLYVINDKFLWRLGIGYTF